MKRTKICSRCGIEKDTSNFSKGRCRGGFNSWCKSCHKEYENSPSIKEYRKKYWKREDIIIRKKKYVNSRLPIRRNLTLKRLYGINIKQYDKIAAKQKNRCAICNRHQSKLNRSLGVDHDHTTGKNRGLLCRHCNLGIGSFQDSINTLKKAIKYLNKHKA